MYSQKNAHFYTQTNAHRLTNQGIQSHGMENISFICHKNAKEGSKKKQPL